MTSTSHSRLARIGTALVLAVGAILLGRGNNQAQAQLFAQPDEPALKLWFAQHGARSFALWNRDPWTPILQNAPDGESVPSPRTAPITLQVLGGETATACAVVTSGQNKPIDVQLPSSVVLQSQGGTALRAQVMALGYLQSRAFGKVAAPLLSAPQIQAIRAEHALPKDQQKLTSIASAPTQILNWTSIEDLPVLHLRPFESVAVWLSFPTKGAKAGRYLGAMQATDMAHPDIPAQRMNFDVTVKPVELPEWTSPDVLTWSALPPVDDPAYNIYLRDLNVHGVRVLWGWHPRALTMGFRRIIVGSGDFWASGTGGAWVDPNKPEEVEKLQNGSYDEAIARAVANLNERARKDHVSNDQWLLELWDEPNDFLAPLYLSVAQKVKRLNPDIRLVANPGAFSGGWHPTSLKTFQILDPVVAEWWPFEQHLTVENGSHLQFVRQSGKPVGFYSTPGGSKDENAARGVYRQLAWQALDAGLKGFGFWAYNTYYGDAWDDSDTGSPDAAVVYPGVLGPIPARNWEAFGRGVEDYRMVRLLEDALTKAATPEARTLQTELTRRIQDAAQNDGSPQRFEQHRAWIKTQILRWVH